MPSIESDLREVYAAANTTKELVKQILTFVRQSDDEGKPIRVGYIAKEVAKFLRSSIPTTIEIQANIESEPRIIGNATQVHQIMMNLKKGC